MGFGRLKRSSEPEHPVALLRNLHLHAQQVHRRWNDKEIGNRRFHDSLANTMGADHNIVGRELAIAALDPKAGTRISLRIEIDNQDALADRRQRGRQIDRRGRLSHAALLICYGNNPVPFAYHAAHPIMLDFSSRPGYFENDRVRIDNTDVF